MNLSLTLAAREDRPVLENLLQLYMYDFSEILGGDVESSGRFADRPLTAYWEDPWRYPFLFRVEDKLAGFALVHQRSRLSGDATTWDMAEFLVLRKYRRRGVGSVAATRLFAMHPGKWEVRQLHANSAATGFWRRVIGAFTGGRFSDAVIDDERWHGPVQCFESRESS
jgi:predicted acetyltransferase